MPFRVLYPLLSEDSIGSGSVLTVFVGPDGHLSLAMLDLNASPCESFFAWVGAGGTFGFVPSTGFLIGFSIGFSISFSLGSATGFSIGLSSGISSALSFRFGGGKTGPSSSVFVAEFLRSNSPERSRICSFSASSDSSASAFLVFFFHRTPFAFSSS